MDHLAVNIWKLVNAGLLVETQITSKQIWKICSLLSNALDAETKPACLASGIHNGSFYGFKLGCSKFMVSFPKANAMKLDANFQLSLMLEGVAIRRPNNKQNFLLPGVSKVSCHILRNTGLICLCPHRFQHDSVGGGVGETASKHMNNITSKQTRNVIHMRACDHTDFQANECRGNATHMLLFTSLPTWLVTGIYPTLPNQKIPISTQVQ